jgi:C1A family cysteine protease
MKTYLLIICIVFSYLYSNSQEAEYTSPLNPDYVKYRQQISAGIFHISKDGYMLNEEPLQYLYSFDRYLETKTGKGIQYDDVYDLRTLGWVSPVVNQGSCGVCWTFATVASLESWILKFTWGIFDFSEQNIRTCHGFYLSSGTCTGGNPKKSSAYMTRFSGPVLESEDPYNSDPSSQCQNIYPPAYRISGYRSLPNDMNTIKDALIARGALYTNMYYDDQYYNSGNYTYYYSGTNATDHAVTLVGWDDNKLTAGGTGAWIIKNSWGPSWGENGFFYISYNDTKVNSTVAYWTDPEPFDTTETLYMYDELGHVSNRGYGDSLGYALVKFVVGSNAQNIEKVGTWVNTAGANLEIEIYDTKNGNTLTGLLSSLTGLNCDFPGYYSFNLPAAVPLAAGEDFYVKVKYVTPGYNYPIPYEALSTANAEPVIEAGVGWYSHSGTSWTATGNDIAGKEYDFCIRAYGHNQSSVGYDGTNRNNRPLLFPNPAKGNVSVNIPEEGYFSVSVFDLTGRCLFSSIINEGSKTITINCSELKSGMYITKFETLNGPVSSYLFIE